MSKMNKVIKEISELNKRPQNMDSDMLTVDKHGETLHIYSRFHLWRDTIFNLDGIARVLQDNHCVFYLSSTRYGHPAIVVPF